MATASPLAELPLSPPDSALRDFLNQHQRPGYYALHGPEFEAGSIEHHRRSLDRLGYSIISRHASCSGSFYFGRDLKPLNPADVLRGSPLTQSRAA